MNRAELNAMKARAARNARLNVGINQKRANNPRRGAQQVRLRNS